MARLVTTDIHFDIRRRPQPKVREKTDDFMEPMQRLPEPRRQRGDLFDRQISITFLDRTQLLDDHEITRIAG